MTKSTTTANDILKLYFNATAIANIADNAATSPLTNIFVALHTAAPGVGGTQTTSESAYTNYARQTVARTTGGWTAASAASTSPVAAITFPTSGAGTLEVITHFSVGVAVSGASKIIQYGTVTPNISMTATGSVTPQLTTATTITEA